jgi:adenosylcobinamide kinase / adenosylcobinamide-phosphate guanylyltransferase
MLTVLLGGARSGKSALAEELGRRSDAAVTYVATCPRIAGDDELALRIERHRGERPDEWTTIEEEIDLAGAIASSAAGLLIVDCLTLWVNNLQFHGHDEDSIIDASRRAIGAVRHRTGDAVVVSNEVGLGIVPADAATRDYRDVLGRVNRDWAEAADRALFVVAGRALALHDPHEVLHRP